MLGARIRDLRLGLGLTQAQLAERAGVSRQLIGAVEAGRHLPRVDAAVALARVLDTSVETLLTPQPIGVVGVIAPPAEGALVRAARVGDQLVCVAARPVGESWPAADGVVHDGEVVLFDGEPTAAVVAGCDPAIGMVAQLVESGGGPGVVAVGASSAAAITALQAGRVHAVVVHGPRGGLPVPPVPVRRWRVARWQVGLAGAADLPRGWAADALTGRSPVVQREAGAGSQSAFERAVASAGGTGPFPGPQASGHVEAASWATRDRLVAVSIEPAALATGLAFHALEEHVSELWVATDHLAVPGVRYFADELIASSRLQRRLVAIGGYDLTDRGIEVAA